MFEVWRGGLSFAKSFSTRWSVSGVLWSGRAGRVARSGSRGLGVSGWPGRTDAVGRVGRSSRAGREMSGRSDWAVRDVDTRAIR